MNATSVGRTYLLSSSHVRGHSTLIGDTDAPYLTLTHSLSHTHSFFYQGLFFLLYSSNVLHMLPQHTDLINAKMMNCDFLVANFIEKISAARFQWMEFNQHLCPREVF
ncbi:hypothetical protein QVD17_04072 [Tagetes erecta]|uniref:Uncharacterized protein n=1 Tax=Tagetes erecta TaxID=13708 RepID=A0AAD8LFX1_TARER|nr:hypothetical protein QVD17_04072 [Tagetes erecta]